MEFFGIFIFAIFGAAIGSFSVAQVWRIRAAQIQHEKSRGEKVSKKEFERLKSLFETKISKDRSKCLKCGYQLKWFDLVPIFSWILLKGKCRKCHASIGYLEIIAEVFCAVIFALVFSKFLPTLSNFENLKIANLLQIFVLFIAFIPLTILFIYDFKWQLLPEKLIWLFDILALCFWIIANISNIFEAQTFINLLLSMSIFPLIYLILTHISKGKWVGDGDWILAIGLIFLIPNNPFFAMILMFLSNFIGLLHFAILAIFRKSKATQIAFAPAMILATILIIIFEPFLNDFLRFLI